ncbi:MAG: hypothetical protein JWN32_3224 [Solirubrobacterales bacterium]|nr:hypothetical protein [Solirubrobacterales bacterium]
MGEIEELTQLVARERRARDRGRWTQMRDCFHADGIVGLSWFEGSADEFVARSTAMSDQGDRASHRLSPPAVYTSGARAVIELPMSAQLRTGADGVEGDLVSTGRLLYRVESRAGEWRIASLDAIYERDSLVPAPPGANPTIDTDELASLRRAYRLLAYHLGRRGYTIAQDLCGDDQPELYRSTHEWARAGAATPADGAGGHRL